jgi:hypothetical protein
MTKHYEQDNLLLVYHKYDTPSTSKIEKFSRSLVIDTNTWKIISFTCQNPILNGDAQQIILNNSNIPFEYYRCYEGSLLSMFYHNDKWYLSSRRCLRYQVMSRFLCKLNNTLLVEIAVLVRVVPSQQKVLLLQTPSLVQSLSMLE